MNTKPLVQDNNKQIVFLDALRGIAAVYVVMGHARWLLWEGYAAYLTHSAQYSFPEKILVYTLAVTKYGHQAVLFFFVLSGFVIHYKYSKALNKDADSMLNIEEYFSRRIRRIYPPFFFAMILTFILDTLGHQLGYTIYFSQTPNTLINTNVIGKHDIVTFIGNLFFFQTEHIGIWGTNGPSWSLKYEWWFYLIYPALLLFNKKSVVLGCVVVVLLYILSTYVYSIYPSFFVSIFQYLLSWWLGAILADIYHKRIIISYFLLSFFTCLIPLMILFQSCIKNTSYADTIWAFGFFGLLNLFFYLQEKGVSFAWAKKIKWLGDCSYTLYITHFPILVFMNGLILHHTNNVLPKSLIFIFIAIVILPIYAYLLHFLTENLFIKKRV